MKKCLCFVALGATLLTAAPIYASLANGEPFTVETDQAGFRIDGQYQLLRGGSLQWWRLPESAWRDRIKRFKAAGFNTIDLYVPWNVIEPREGEFNFTQPNLTGFLALCKSLGIYVYLRPGPYITNEMDGGGIPGWLVAHSTKQSLALDGRPNLRTDDPDYLAYVRRYFSRLNNVIRPYLASQGGPIVLYAIENEYNWFEIFSQLDKFALYQGQFERPLNTAGITRRYLSALRDMVITDGIDVPITSCPGDGKLSGLGGVAGIVPIPNMYPGLGAGKPEKTVFSLLQKMHDPLLNHGIYVNFPSGTTETDRVPANIKRMLMAGLDATFAFNVFGTHQDGYRNGMALNTDSIKALIDTADKRSLSEKMAGVQVGYYHSVTDFNGAMSPSGGHREMFYDFRRDNGFFDTVTPWLAPQSQAHRSGSQLPGGDTALSISQPEIGTKEGFYHVHYWMQHADGAAFISLVNESQSNQIIPVNGIHFNSTQIPQYAPLTIPLKNFDGKPQFGDVDLSNAIVLTYDLPISGMGKLHYSTSEMMWLRPFNDETLLLLHGQTGTAGELALSQMANLQITHADAGITVQSQSPSTLVVTYTHGEPQQLLLTDANDHRLRVLITDSPTAGRAWMLDDAKPQALVVGADYIDQDTLVRRAQGVQLTLDHSQSPRSIYVISPGTVSGDGTQISIDSETQTTRFLPATGSALTTLPDLLANARTQSDLAEAGATFDDSYWQHWTGNAEALEPHNITTGHAWYRSRFTLTGKPTENMPLFVEGASDIVGIYVNGHYVSTVSPLGTAIDGASRNSHYALPSLTPYLHQGDNTIAFRTEIWGHGSFMFPRGKLFLFGPSIPAVGFDALKGLQGIVKVGATKLKSWSLRAGLGGENVGFASPAYDDRQWTPAPNAVTLQKGDIRWLRTTFNTEDLPDAEKLQAPIVLALKGKRCKASIFLNGNLIGRWISDNEWLGHGFWGSGIRDMWMNTDPDHFPIDAGQLNQTGKPNVLAIAFEDASSATQAPGTVDEMRLQYATENQRFNASGAAERISAIKSRTPMGIRW